MSNCWKKFVWVGGGGGGAQQNRVTPSSFDFGLGLGLWQYFCVSNELKYFWDSC